MNLRHVMLKKEGYKRSTDDIPILANRACAQPAKIPSVTTSPNEEAIGHAMLSKDMDSLSYIRSRYSVHFSR